MNRKLLMIIFLTGCSNSYQEKPTKLLDTPQETIPVTMKVSVGVAQKLLNLNGPIGFNQLKPFIHNECGGCHRTDTDRQLHVDSFPFTLGGSTPSEIAAEIKRRINADADDNIHMPKYGQKLDGIGLAAMNRWLDRGMPGDESPTPNSSLESLKWTYTINNSPDQNMTLAFRPQSLEWEGNIPVPSQNQITITVTAATADGNIIIPSKTYSAKVEYNFFDKPDHVSFEISE